MTSDLGGKDQLSQAQMILVDDVARLTFWIDSIDGWLLTLESVVNKRKRALVPVIKERTALVETRAGCFKFSGWSDERSRCPLSPSSWPTATTARFFPRRAAIRRNSALRYVFLV